MVSTPPLIVSFSAPTSTDRPFSVIVCASTWTAGLHRTFVSLDFLRLGRSDHDASHNGRGVFAQESDSVAASEVHRKGASNTCASERMSFPSLAFTFDSK